MQIHEYNSSHGRKKGQRMSDTNHRNSARNATVEEKEKKSSVARVRGTGRQMDNITW